MLLSESSYCYIFRMGVYILVLVTQHASRIISVQQYIVMCVFQDLPYLSTLYHKSREIRKRNIEHKKSVMIFLQILSKTVLILRRVQRNVQRTSCKVPVILFRFSWNLYFLDNFSKNPETSNLITSYQQKPRFFQADRQRDRQTDGTKEGTTDRHDESNSRFRHFANTSKIFVVVLSAAV